jgi:hypothetical protein
MTARTSCSTARSEASIHRQGAGHLLARAAPGPRRLRAQQAAAGSAHRVCERVAPLAALLDRQPQPLVQHGCQGVQEGHIHDGRCKGRLLLLLLLLPCCCGCRGGWCSGSGSTSCPARPRCCCWCSCALCRSRHRHVERGADRQASSRPAPQRQLRAAGVAARHQVLRDRQQVQEGVGLAQPLAWGQGISGGSTLGAGAGRAITPHRLHLRPSTPVPREALQRQQAPL